MGYFLAPYVGTGSHLDPYRPAGVDARAWSAVDLRPDASVLSGFALVAAADVTDPAVDVLAEDKFEVLSTARRNRLKNRLGVNFDETRLDEIVAKLLLAPPANGWKALRPNRRTRLFEIWLGGEILWSKAATIGPAGELVDPSDDFNRSNETPLASPWTRLSGGTGNINLASNAIQAAAVGDKFYYYSGAAATEDQFSEFTIAAKPSSNDWGPAARVGANGFSGYIAANYDGSASFRGISKFVGGTFSMVVTGPATAVGDVVRIEAEGSTIRRLVDGVQDASATDTSLTGVANGPGVFLYETGGSIDDFNGGDLADPPETTGPVSPTQGTTAAEAPWSDNDWTTPGNIVSDNAATANITATSYDSPDQSFVLKAHGFDFSSIPDDATIVGVEAKINAFFRAGQGAGSLDLAQLLDVSRAKGGTNKASPAIPLSSTTSTIITLGGPTDLWGRALTPAWVKDPDFGIALGMLATAANADVDVDHVSLEVFYTVPATTVVGEDLSVIADVRAIRNEILAAPYDLVAHKGRTSSFVYDVRTPVFETLAALADVRALAGRTLAAPADVRAIRNEILAAVFDVRATRDETLAVPYDLRTRAFEETAFVYDLLAEAVAGRTLAAVYDVRAAANEILAVPYDLEVPVGRTLAAPADVRAIRNEILAVVYDLERTIGRTHSYPYDVRALAAETAAFRYDLTGRASEETAFVYDVTTEGVVSETLLVLYDVRAARARVLAAPYDLRALRGRSLDVLADVRALRGLTLAAAADVRALRSRILSALANLRALRGLTLSGRYDVEGTAGIPGDVTLEVVQRERVALELELIRDATVELDGSDVTISIGS